MRMFTSMTGQRLRFVVLLTVLALVVAACGTRLSDEERAVYTARGGGGGQSDSGSGDFGESGEFGDGSGDVGGGETGTADGGGAPDASGGGGGGGEDAGGGDSGGGAPGGGPAAAGDDPCAGSASGESGVSDSTITIGNVSQLSGAIPGFAQESVRGAQAYVAFVNATGGLCGRELELLVADDGFDASRNASETSKLEPRVLAFGGSFSVTDSGMAVALRGKNITDVGVPTNKERQQLPNTFTHLVSNNSGKPGAEWKYAASKGAKKAIVVHVAAAAARDEGLKAKASMESAGLTVEMLEISNTQFSFAGPAQAVMNSGAQLMLFISDVNASVQMLTEMRDRGPPLPFEWYRIAYGPEFLERAGDKAEETVAFTETLPFEEAGKNEEMAMFQEWLRRVSPSSTPNFQAINSWIAMKLLVESIRDIDGDITRDALLASVKSKTAYAAGGLIEPINPSLKDAAVCKVVVRVRGGKWVREAPASGFVC